MKLTKKLKPFGSILVALAHLCLLKIKVKAGHKVKKGQPLLILSVMKTENIITDDVDAIVGRE